MSKIKTILFTKDRPLQCHAMLESLLKNGDGLFDIDVLVKLTDKASIGYANLWRTFNTELTTLAGMPVRFFAETKGFQDHIIDIMEQSPYEYFCILTDDCIMHDNMKPISYSSIDAAFKHAGVGAFSLRMGSNTVIQRYWDSLRQPTLQYKPHYDFIYWDVMQYSFDWNWAWLVSFDGHIFRKGQILEATKRIKFDEIHHYESQLHQFRGNLFNTLVAAPLFSKVVCLSYNYVSSPATPDNFGKHLHVTAEELLEKYQEGFKFDLAKMLSGVKIESCHTELPIHFTKTL